MEDDDLKVDPVFASHNIMIKDCENNNIIPYGSIFFPLFLSYMYCNSTPNSSKKIVL